MSLPCSFLTQYSNPESSCYRFTFGGCHLHFKASNKMWLWPAIKSRLGTSKTSAYPFELCIYLVYKPIYSIWFRLSVAFLQSRPLGGAVQQCARMHYTAATSSFASCEAYIWSLVTSKRVIRVSWLKVPEAVNKSGITSAEWSPRSTAAKISQRTRRTAASVGSFFLRLVRSVRKQDI